MPPPITTASRTGSRSLLGASPGRPPSLARASLAPWLRLPVWRAPARGAAPAAADARPLRARRARHARRGLRDRASARRSGTGSRTCAARRTRAFTRGPYLLRVSGSEAALRWRVRGGKRVTLTAVAPDGHAGRRRRRRAARPAARHALLVGRERRRHGAGERLVHHAAARRSTAGALRRARPTTARATTTSGRSAALLAAQRPEFAVTAGDNSYLVAAEVLLDRNIFRPLGELIGSAPMYVCLGDHDNFFPGPGAISSAFDLPEGGRYTVRYGPIQVVDPRRRAERAGGDRVRRAARCASPGRRCASSPATARCRPATPSCRCCARAGATPSSRGHLHRYERRTVDGVQTFTVGTGGQGPGSLDAHQGDARGRHQPARHRRADGRRARRRPSATRILDKHGKRARPRGRSECSADPAGGACSAPALAGLAVVARARLVPARGARRCCSLPARRREAGHRSRSS